MWIYLEDGNISLSRHRDIAGAIMARARDRASLEAVFPCCKITETPEADYRWRITIQAEDVARIISDRILSLDYADDVKNVVGHNRRDLYRDIWAVTRGYQGGG